MMTLSPYSREEAVSAVLEGGQLPSEVARERGIASKTLLKWLRENHQPFESRKVKLQQEIQSLEHRLASLRHEFAHLD
ncbi:transposase [Shewanella sp. JM162201]|uniref:Transposase n=1 Tax=Shewanella jiangmenensis TaxID=2837387 RepID=A0ABS5V0B8_9GAMM|nr:transposase [Shewanella jiangmenensis]MBT1443916.1 transposase [Shewanella jiangmenensis]